MSTTRDLSKFSPEVQKFWDKLNAEQDAKRKIEWDAAQSAHFPKSDPPPYVPDEAEFLKLLKKYSGMDIHEQWKFRHDELMAEGKTFDEASKAASSEWATAEDANPVNLMSMAVGGDAGFPLDKMEEHDAEFRKMCEDMMLALPSETKILAGSLNLEAVKQERSSVVVSLTDPKEKWEAVNKQNELNESKTEEGNGGSTLDVSHGEQTPHTPPTAGSALHSALSETTASVVVPTIEEGGVTRTGSTG